MMSLVGVGHRKVHVFDKSLGGAKLMNIQPKGAA